MVIRSRLTLDDARDLPHEELIERCEAILELYDPPEVETQPQKLDRLSRTIDEIPQVYRWFWQLWSYFDNWSAGMATMYSQSDSRYKMYRQRRDLFEKMASAAKQRYEGASRIITVMSEFEPNAMPRQRALR